RPFLVKVAMARCLVATARARSVSLEVKNQNGEWLPSISSVIGWGWTAASAPSSPSITKRSCCSASQSLPAISWCVAMGILGVWGRAMVLSGRALAACAGADPPPALAGRARHNHPPPFLARPMSARLLKPFLSTWLTGLLAVVPLVMTLGLVAWVVGLLNRFVGPASALGRSFSVLGEFAGSPLLAW